MPESLRELWPAFLALATGLLGWRIGSARNEATAAERMANLADRLSKVEGKLESAAAGNIGVAERLARIEAQISALTHAIERRGGGQ
jgi:hypothetical protein